jgi:hypothetical protein
VTLAEALVALGAASGLAAFTVKIGLWSKFSPAEKAEIEALDADMPDRFLAAVGSRLPTAAKMGGGTGFRFHWRKGNWKVGNMDNGDVYVNTPVLLEGADELTR